MSSDSLIARDGLVLAGGHSTRFGTDKAFYRFEGQTLLERQLALLVESGCDQIFISGRGQADFSDFDFPVLLDGFENGGPLAGIAAGLAACSASHLLVLAVDMPAMNLVLLKRLVLSCSDGIGAVLHHSQGYEPLAAVYPRALLIEMESRLSRRDLSLQPLLAYAEQAGLMRRIAIGEQERASLLNVNSVADLCR